ncbi:MAG: TolC family protein [Candidatus Omnitrophota bacterium]
MKIRCRIFTPVLVICALTGVFYGYQSAFSREDPEGEGTKPVKKIVFLYDGPDLFYENEMGAVRKELRDLAGEKYSFDFIGEENGSWDEDEIRSKLEELLSDNDADLIIGAGVLLGRIVSSMESFAKPLILADYYDTDIMKMPYREGVSGIGNLTYLSIPGMAEEQLKAFRKVIPFKTLHIYVDSVLLAEAGKIAGRLSPRDFKIIFTGYGESAEEALAALKGSRAEAVYLTPSSFLPVTEYQKLIDGLNGLKVPAFSALGYVDVEKGVLAGQMPKLLTKFARRIAVNVERVFSGEDAGNIPVEFKIEKRFVVNARTAREIGISLPFDVLFSAEVLNAGEGWGEKLSIYEAVNEAAGNNLLFRIRDEEIEQARQDHLIKWSEYLPQVKYSLQYDINDSERAQDAMGLLPKWYLRNRFSFTQLIFSDPVITEIRNSKKTVEISKLEKRSATLDITEETAAAYLEYLRQKALLKVRMETLEANRQHLRTAKSRHDIGVAGREEMLRWESEVASSESDVIQASSDIQIAKITLNQLMNHPQEMPFSEEDPGLETVGYYIASSRLEKFLKNRETLMVMLDYMTLKAFENSPEIQVLDIAISQRKLNKDTAMRKFFLPEASVEGYTDHKLRQKYLGAIPRNDHDDWYFGLQLSYPVFEGGAKAFDYEKQKSEWDRVRFKRDLQKQFVELDVRKAVYRMAHSYPNISLSRTAMDNATENYDIVKTKYSKGTASITDLIDAQNDKFTQEARALISVYDFLYDVYTFDRAVSEFYSFAPKEEQEKWVEGLTAYMTARGVDVEQP